MTSALEAALIGDGGSVVGGIVGGWFAIVAVRSQWKRDRASIRADRSHQAALSIAESMASVDDTLVALSKGLASPASGRVSLQPLQAAVNTFIRTDAVQSMALTDEALRERVRTHTELLNVVTQHLDGNYSHD